MGSLVSPIVAKLYMEHFEREALSSASNPLRLWYRFVDDTWVIQQQAHKQLFLYHINSIDPAIKSTVEGNVENWAIPFLYTLAKLEADNSLSIKVYCKPAHTDQYLQWDSHHNLSAKYSVIGTLTHRAKMSALHQSFLMKNYNLRKALVRWKYPSWAIFKVQNKVINDNQEGNSINSTQVNSTTQGISTSSNSGQDTTSPSGRPSKGHIVIPYIQGLGESIKHTCTKCGIQTFFKGNSTLMQLLVRPKDEDPKEKASGVIYSYQCGTINCGEEYISETSRTLGNATKTT